MFVLKKFEAKLYFFLQLSNLKSKFAKIFKIDL